MITLTREEAEHVLKLLDKFDTFNDFTDVRQPLRAKLSAPEPVAVCILKTLVGIDKNGIEEWKEELLYTAPPQRKECLRCGEVNPADVHTCTPMTVKDIQTSDKNADEFTEFMKLHRAINGLSQVMLAEKIGIATAAIGQWERNETSPRYQTIFKIAKVFNVPTTEIFTLLSKRKNAKKENRL